MTNDGNNRGKHIQPQRITIENLRPKIKKTIEFTAKKKENAVDIYFLLDLSGSMNPYKKQLLSVPQELIQANHKQ